MSKLQLYTFYLSTTAWRARIALNLKKIVPEYKFVHLFKGQQKSSQYQKVNPNTGVPSLVLANGTILIQSMAIIQYLNEIKPQPYNLFIGSFQQRALIRGFCQVINSGIHPYQNLKLLNILKNNYSADLVQWNRKWRIQGLGTIQALIKKIGKSEQYVFGNMITAADVFFYPQVLSTKLRFGINLQPFPNVNRILSNLQKIQQFKNAQPENQPDFQTPKK